jgi:hypothetical protein
MPAGSRSCGWAGFLPFTPNQPVRRRYGAVGVALATSGQADRCGVEHPEDSSRLWPEGWSRDPQGFEARIQELVAGQAMLERIAKAMLSARATLQAEFNKLHEATLRACGCRVASF